jgi:hypothetical protein
MLWNSYQRGESFDIAIAEVGVYLKDRMLDLVFLHFKTVLPHHGVMLIQQKRV